MSNLIKRSLPALLVAGAALGVSAPAHAGTVRVEIKGDDAMATINGKQMPVIGGKAAIVAQNGGNIVAQGGGNIVAQGGGNLKVWSGQ